MPDVSIAISAQDSYSSAIKSMAQVTKSFSKDAAHMEEILRKLNANKASLKLDAKNALQELKEAQKQFAATGEEADALKMNLAQANYDNITRNLDLVTRGAREAERQMRETGEAIRRADNRAGSAGGNSSMLGQLAQAGLTKMVGDTLSSAANTFVGSAFGSDAGTMFSSTLSGAAAGAALGSIVPVLGTAVGAAVGGALGAVNGGIQIYQEQDDAIKATTTDQYSALQAKRAAELESGSTIAGGREQTRMAFDKLLGGPEAAGRYLDEVQKLAVDTNYTYDEITGYTKKLLNSFASDDVLGMLMDLSDATAGLSLNSSDVDIFVDGLNRMKTRGKATREYLDYFDTRGLNTSEALARALKIDKSQVADKVTKGEVTGDQAVSAILQYIKDEYGGLSVDLASSYDAKMDNLGDIMDGINARLGGAYNDTRGTGLDSDLAEYGGALGDALGNMNAYIGEGRALAENLSGQYTKEALSAVLLGKETTLAGFGPEQQARLAEMNISYANLQALYATSNDEEKAGLSADMEALRSEAEGMAESAFKMSDASLAIQDSERDLVAALRENTIALGSWKADYYMAQEQSKGAGGGILERIKNAPYLSTVIVDFFTGTKSTGFERRDRAGGGTFGAGGGGFSGGFAYGLARVPYDNFPALLHEGERVLTANQVRQQDSGGGGFVFNNYAPITVREEADIGKIAQAMLRDMQRAKFLRAP